MVQGLRFMLGLEFELRLGFFLGLGFHLELVLWFWLGLGSKSTFGCVFLLLSLTDNGWFFGIFFPSLIVGSVFKLYLWDFCSPK